MVERIALFNNCPCTFFFSLPRMGTLLLSSFEYLSNVAERGNVVPHEATEFCDIGAPVALQLARHGEPVDELDTMGRHALVGGLARVLRQGPRGVGHDEDFVAELDKGQSSEGDADLGGNAAVKDRIVQKTRMHHWTKGGVLT